MKFKKNLKFWKKKDKNDKPEDDKKAKLNNSTDDIKSDVIPDAENDKNLSSHTTSDVKPEAKSTDGVKDTQKTDTTQISAKEAAVVTSKIKTAKETDKTKKVERAKEHDPGYDVPSGVYIFGRKIEGKFTKFMFGLWAIFLMPPTFLFCIALLMCVFLLIYPLLTLIVFAVFPTIIFSILICLAVVPVVFPFIVIFLLFSGKGILSLFSEGKLFFLKFFRWTLPKL